jgi:hypothetical protein
MRHSWRAVSWPPDTFAHLQPHWRPVYLLSKIAVTRRQRALPANRGPTTIAGMADTRLSDRLEVRVLAAQRRELVQLAAATGVSVPGLVRLATQRLLADRNSLLPDPHTEEHAA